MHVDLELLTILFAVNSIGALGFYVTFTSGQFSLAHGALYAIGGYAGAYVTTALGWNFLLAIVSGFACSAIIGGVLARLLAGVRGLYFGVATLAFGVVVVEAIKRIPALGGPFGLAGVPIFTDLPVAIVALVLVGLVAFQLDRSPLYVAHAAARVDQDAALVMGIDVKRTRGVAFAMGGGITGIAGVLYAGSTSVVSPDLGSFHMSLAFLLMVVIGGANSWRGPILGAAIWTVLPEVFRSTDELRMVLFGVAAIVIVVWRPQGLIPRRIFRAKVDVAKIPAMSETA